MKTYSESAPLTPEDRDIWVYHVMERWPQAIESVRLPLIHMSAEAADASDAYLMLDLATLRLQGSCYLRIGRENCLVPAVHVLVRKNPLWPADWAALL